MTTSEARTLQDLGTRLEWVYPAEQDPAMLTILAPLFPWANGAGDADAEDIGAGSDTGEDDGAAYRTRTCDPRITNAMLYQLS
jgi:hypothetical protein